MAEEERRKVRAGRTGGPSRHGLRGRSGRRGGAARPAARGARHFGQRARPRGAVRGGGGASRQEGSTAMVPGVRVEVAVPRSSRPESAWLDLDLRSEYPHALAQLDVTVRAALERAADDENRRRTTGSPTLLVEIQLLGDRPSGMTPRAHPLVQAAVAANRALGRDAERASASTDANVPTALGN